MEPNPGTPPPRRTRRPPWLVPAVLLLLLTAAALVDRPATGPGMFSASQAGGAFDALGSIESDPANPVRSQARFLWNSVAGADAYEVRFWSHDMREVRSYPAGSGNMVVLDLEEIWRPVAPSRVIHWRVVALAGGKELASSDLQMLRLP